MSKTPFKASDKTETVKVVVRCRPLNSTEQQSNESTAVDVNSELGSITVYNTNNDTQQVTKEINKKYTFDYTYPPNTPQTLIFTQTAKSLIDSVLNGYNGTIFAYGQTGTGKTFTMEGIDTPTGELRGIMPQSFNYIFDRINTDTIQYLVRVSFIEIYLDDVYDLLASKRTKMDIKESNERGVFVKDLSIYNVKSVAELNQVLSVGQKQRKVGATKMNAGSSRSHSILTITIESSIIDSITGSTHYKVGKLNLVDLAGSERQKKTEATGERLDEAKSINWSLTVLGNCIKALIDPKSTFVPYRDSKLTRLLQDSLGGNTKTVMIANIGPAGSNVDETISTLRYADRAKQIKNKPVINEDSKDMMLRSMQDEIAKLQAELAARNNGSAGGLSNDIIQLLNKHTTTNHAGETMIDVSQLPSHMIQERIIEKTVVRHTGINDDDYKQRESDMLNEIELMKQNKLNELAIHQQSIDHASAAQAEYERTLQQGDQVLTAEEHALQQLKQALLDKEKLILQGSEKLTQAQLHKDELKQIEYELKQRHDKQAKLAQQLHELELNELNLTQHYTNATDELQSKNQKLKKLYNIYQNKKHERNEIITEYEQEKIDLIENITVLTRQLKLKQCIVDDHIPRKYQDIIESNSYYDNIQDIWIVRGIEYTGVHTHITQNILLNQSVNDTMHYESTQQQSYRDKPIRPRQPLKLIQPTIKLPYMSYATILGDAITQRPATGKKR